MRVSVASTAGSATASTQADEVTVGTKRPAWEFGVGILLCLCVLVVAICTFVVSIVKFGAASESNGWRPITATITQSEVISQGKGRRKSYKAFVRYSYVVDAITYTSERVSFGQEGSFIDGRWTASKYKVGTTHTAWFNPQRPAEAVLEKGISWTIILWLLASLVVIIASTGGAVFCGVFMWRRMKSST